VLANALLGQTTPFSRWVIVDNGSSDRTLDVARWLEIRDERIEVIVNPGQAEPTRGAPIAHALQAGFARLSDTPPDIVVAVDADVSLAPGFFELLLGRFALDHQLGIASGAREEEHRHRWVTQRVTGTSVEAQCRAYRWPCLQAVLPFDDHMAWDSVDEVKANLNGWRTEAFPEPKFRHNRRIGARDRARIDAWTAAGAAGYYLGYRPSYLLLRSLYRALRDPAAVAMLRGYLDGVRKHGPQAEDAVRAYVANQQRARRVPSRIREALGFAKTTLT
jgi:glycosyltransferase involved in cell wall biosynthesis